MARSSFHHCKTKTYNALDYKLEEIDNILKIGDPKSEKTVIEKLDDLQSSEADVTKILQIYRNKQGDTLAHTAATYYKEPGVLIKILETSSGLLMESRKGGLKGQTVLHLAISGKKLEMVNALLTFRKVAPAEKNKKFPLTLLKKQAVGHKFKNTVMMGQLPLSVAALANEREIVSLLLDHGADIAWQNADGDTVFHSLIRYASVHIDKIDDISKMINILNKRLESYLTQMKKPNKLYQWHIVNNQGMTPLQLAASLGLEQLFRTILDLKKTYRFPNDQDGDVFLYDITEIDTITQAEWERYPPKGLTMESALDSNKKSWGDPGHWPVLSHKSPSVLELICQLPVQQANQFLCNGVIKELINQKWDHYKRFLLPWALFHAFVMVHITIYAVYKTKVLKSNLFSDFHVSEEERNFVNATAGILFLYAILNLCPEAVRCFSLRKICDFRRTDDNNAYRAMLIVFSFALIIDSIWFYSRPHNNYFLILALILGWSFMGFFFRTIKRFSFSTVMFLKILGGDLTRLAVVILLQLFVFSTAIYTTFHNVQSAEGFENYGKAIITMFNLMIGLDDIHVLNDARDPWLAILLYIVFVLVTYILLFNSLIAMMSLTCDRITNSRDAQWKFQQLSLILFLESSLLPKWRYMPKNILPIRRYGIPSKEYRCYVESSRFMPEGQIWKTAKTQNLSQVQKKNSDRKC